MFVSCSCLVCDKNEYPTVDETLGKIRSLGFSAFDLDLLENWQHINPSELVDSLGDWIPRLRELMERLDLKAASFNCGLSRRINDPSPESFRQYKREFAAIVELASALDCPNITLQPGGIQSEKPIIEQIEVITDHLLELAEIRGDRPITVSIEAHANSPIEKPEDALRLAQKVYPVAGLTYDPSHFVLQDIPLSDTAELIDYSYHVHVRNAASGEMQATMADGILDFAWLVAELRNRSSEIGIAIEYFGGFDRDFSNTVALREKLIGLGVMEKPI